MSFEFGQQTPKKYVVFEIVEYYSEGGISDIADSFDDLHDAKAFVENSRYDCQIVDRDTWLLIE